MANFQKLFVWQKAKDLAVEVYRLTKSCPSFQIDDGLQNQLRRAAISVPSNIAEGDELRTNRQSVHFLYIAKGSIAEIRTQLIIAYEIDYISKDVMESLESEYAGLAAMIHRVIVARSKSPLPPDNS
jgi:four helix bundle protein